MTTMAATHDRWREIAGRLAAGLAVALAVALALRTPPQQRQMRTPDPWAYAFAVENFAQGRWVVTKEALAAGRMNAREQGGFLTQYVNVGPDRWALEKAPGYSLLVVPFYWLGLPQLANGVLAVVAALALYILMARQYDEGLALAAVTLFLLAPMSLIAQQTMWMDTFASGTVPLIGGALYALCLLQPPASRARLALAFGAGLALGWSAVVRLSNVLLVGLCGLHLLVTLWRTPQKRPILTAAVAFALGAAISLGVLAAYNQVVFGNVFDLGYAYSSYRVSFAFGVELGKPGEPASSTSFASAAAMIGRNLVRLVQPWLLGFPLLILAIPGWIVTGRGGLPQAAGERKAAPGWLTLVWILAVAMPTVSFTWLDKALTQPANRGELFFGVDRYFFPWMFPLIPLAIAALARLPRWAAWGAVAFCTVGSLLIYAHVYPRL